MTNAITNVVTGVTGVIAAVMSGPALASAARMESRMAANMKPAVASRRSRRLSLRHCGGSASLRGERGAAR